MAFSFISRFAQDANLEAVPTDITYTIPVTTDSSSSASGIGMTLLFIYLIFIVIYLICAIKIFQKAGRKWWEAIIPIYSTYVLLQIIKRPGWWLLLLFVPFVNIVISIIIALDLAKVFGKSVVFAIFGLLLFSFVGYPMLAFGSAKYEGGDSTPTQPDNSPSPTPPAPEAPAAPTPPQQPPAAPPTNLVQ